MVGNDLILKFLDNRLRLIKFLLKKMNLGLQIFGYLGELMIFFNFSLESLIKVSD